MKSYIKSDDAYKTIGEVTKELGLINKKTGNIHFRHKFSSYLFYKFDGLPNYL